MRSTFKPLSLLTLFVVLSWLLPAAVFAGPFDALFEANAKWKYSGSIQSSACVGPIEGWVCTDDCCKLDETFEMICKVAETSSTDAGKASRVVCVGSPKAAMGVSPSYMLAGCWLLDKKGLHHNPDCAALEAALPELAKSELILPAKPKATKWPKCKDKDFCERSRVVADGELWCAEEELIGGDSNTTHRCFDNKRGPAKFFYDIAAGTSVTYKFELQAEAKP